MFIKKIKKIIILFLFLLLICLPFWFLVPVKKVLAFGFNPDKKVFLNKKMNNINVDEIKNIIMKDEDIKNIKIVRTPFGIIFVFTTKRKILAYFNDNVILKGIDENGVIFKTKDINKRLPVLSGNKNKIIEGLYLLRINKDIDTIFLTEDCPLTKDGKFKILWGNDDYSNKKKIIEKIKKNQNEKGVIDMRFKNNIFFIEEEKWLN